VGGSAAASAGIAEIHASATVARAKLQDIFFMITLPTRKLSAQLFNHNGRKLSRRNFAELLDPFFGALGLQTFSRSFKLRKLS